jgi:site-specific recombinase XerD
VSAPEPLSIGDHLELPQQVSDYLVHLARIGKATHTLAATRRDLQQLTRFLGPRRVDELASADLHQFAESLKLDRANGPASLRRKVATLKAFFRYLQRNERLVMDPSAALPYPALLEREAEPLSPAELEALLAEPLATAHRALILAMLDAGLKREELLALTASDVVLGSRQGSFLLVSRVLAAKRVRARRVPLGQRPAAAFKDHVSALSPDALLFPLSTRGVDYIVREAGRRTGVPRRGGLTPQRLRDTFAARWIAERLASERAVFDANARRDLEARHDRELVEILGLSLNTMAVRRYRRAAARLEHNRPEAMVLADVNLASAD